jgi:hypothetical protein
MTYEKPTINVSGPTSLLVQGSKGGGPCYDNHIGGPNTNSSNGAYEVDE